MKKLFFIIATLAAVVAAAVAAPFLMDDPGHVRVDIGGWRLEMSVLVLVGLIVLSWVVLSIAMGLFRLPGKALHRAHSARAERQLEQGLLSLAEGDWAQAEQQLGRALKHRDSPAAYLAAARAAQGQAEPERREAWLQLADARFGRRHRVACLTRARMLLNESRAEEAVPILESLHLRNRRHSGVLRLLLQAYQDADRWRDLRLLTPALRKADIVDAARAEELAVLAAVRELESAMDTDQLEDAWRALPGRLHRARDVVVAYARRAGDLGRPGLAGKSLKQLLEAAPDTEALKLYAFADDSARSGRIADCRRWLEQHPDDEGLHLALGLLYLADRDDARAREHLEKALAQRPDSEAFALLGRVLDRSGQLESAAHCYRNALRLKAGRGAEPLPAPGQDTGAGADGNSPSS